MATDQTKQHPSLTDAMMRITGPKGIVAAEDQLPYLTEWRKRWTGTPALVVSPASTAEVAAIVSHCAKNSIAITPQGGNTGLVGGQIPMGGEILLSLNRMRTIHEVSALNKTMLVDAGVTLGAAQDAAAAQDCLFPLSIGSEGSCQIGGVISTNAGGVNVLRYGNTRELVMGLEVVLPSGEIWDGLNALRKNNTGYDLKQLFIGGEGTLGIVTRAVLKLYPQAEEKFTLIAGLHTPAAVIEFLALTQQVSGGLVSSFEFMARPCLDLVLKNIPGTRDPLAMPYPIYTLVELSAGKGTILAAMGEQVLAAALDQAMIADAAIAQNDRHAQDFWHLRHSISEAMNHEARGARHDVSVPVHQIPAFLAAADRAVEALVPGARPIAFGHVGDGNVHYDVMPPVGADADALDVHVPAIENAIYDVIDRFNGSISAEHGIGQHKLASMAARKSPVEMAMMHAIKRTFDPAGIFNPGKLVVPPPEKH
ncbi:MAG: FAD-binding oxidoreductase [Pseudomonadota bacterium]